jgi:Mpv17 / PMP22 family
MKRGLDCGTTLLFSLWLLFLPQSSHGFIIVGPPPRTVPAAAARHGTTEAAAAASAVVSREATFRLHMLFPPPVVEQLCSTYTYCLLEHELATQSATAGLFAGLGDVLAQTTVIVEPSETKKPYDARRTANFVFKGLGGGIMWNAWFQLSDPLSLSLAQSVLGSDRANAASELVADPAMLLQAMRVGICILLEQCVVSPLLYAVWDIPVPALLSGSPIRQIPAQISSKMGPLLIANAKVWTPANLITYNLPTEFRVLFASCTDLVWQIVCSKITSSEIEVAPPTQQPRTTASVLDSVEAQLGAASPLVVEQGIPIATRTRLVPVSSVDLTAEAATSAVDTVYDSTNAGAPRTEMHTTTEGRLPALALMNVNLEQQLVR